MRSEKAIKIKKFYIFFIFFKNPSFLYKNHVV